MADDKNAKKLSLADIRDEAIKINQIVATWKAGSEDMEALLALVRAQGSLLVEACDRTTDIEKGLLLANRRLTTTIDETVDRVNALEAGSAQPAAPAEGAEGEAAPELDSTTGVPEALKPGKGNGHAAAPPIGVVPPPGPGPGGNIVASVTIKP